MSMSIIVVERDACYFVSIIYLKEKSHQPVPVINLLFPKPHDLSLLLQRRLFLTFTEPNGDRIAHIRGEEKMVIRSFRLDSKFSVGKRTKGSTNEAVLVETQGTRRRQNTLQLIYRTFSILSEFRENNRGHVLLR